ncbi:restriction endonuclease subunit S [Parvimonas sp. G1604]|uniref:restriction endonuclease subunit S n=1 Tax=Parvimonas sp. G1604 TaxID=3388845 RepID=UPI00397FAB7D
MAKKKNNLTLEEKLQNALVPEEEQPYQIPENWVWTYLLEGFAECKDKYRKPVNAKERESREGVVPYYGATGQVGWIDDYLTNEHLVLVGEDGAPFFELLKDKAYIIEGKAWINNHVHIVKSFYGMKGNEYLKHYLNIFNYNGYVNGTTRLKLTQSRLREIPIPMAPILEQQRIVERIESLFSKLDEAKEKIQMSLDSFENRKSAILYKAFSGELTKKWREENGIKFKDWDKVELRERCHINPKKISTKELNDNMDITFIPMASVSDILGEVSEPLVKKLGKYKKGYTNFSEGDILFAKITPCMENGKIAVVEELENNIGFGSTEFHIVRCNNNTYNRFIYHLLRWKKFREEAKAVMSGAVGQQRVPKSFLEEYKISFPSLEEQKEIVRILDTIFDKEQDIQQLIDLIEKVDLMKKSILARAFRGELGTNLPEEESAMELLKSVLEV